ncbi:MAG TPA: hypothetical protein VH120_19050 [Gemmataceae bacterium]|jgi:hypothetical protein|nr:hypothetical protein [Gemmataceae bacterium]
MRSVACFLTIAIAAVGAGGDVAADGERLVVALSSPNFGVRESAAHELDRRGEAALDALRLAATSGDAETRRRANAIIERIGRRQAADRILAPTRVSLNYDHTPLTDALADLSRRIGVPIALHGQKQDLAGRRVSLVAGKVTTWQAVALFCNRSGLHEWDGLSSLSPWAWAEGSSESPPEGVVVLGQLLVRRGQVSALTVPSPAARLALIDGDGPDLPTHCAGSLRIRAAKPGTPFPAEAGRDALIPLQISAEARFHVDGAADLRIDRAVDEQGRNHDARPVWQPPMDDHDDWPRGVRLPPQVTDRKHGPVAVRIAREDASAKRLTELAGTITVQAFVAEPVAELGKPADEVGHTVRRGDAVFTLISVRQSGDDVRMTAEVQLPYGTRLDSPVAGPVGFGGRGRMWGGGPFDFREEVRLSGDEYQGLAVLDAAGRRFAAVSGDTMITGLFPKHYSVRMTAGFRPPAAGTAAARVTFAVRRPTMLDVPFVLHDLPLP